MTSRYGSGFITVALDGVGISVHIYHLFVTCHCLIQSHWCFVPPLLFARDETLVSQAIELNEELHKVLVRHDALLSVHPTTAVASNIKEEEEEEDAESLYRR
jgi:hypothetical protein